MRIQQTRMTLWRTAFNQLWARYSPFNIPHWSKVGSSSLFTESYWAALLDVFKNWKSVWVHSGTCRGCAWPGCLEGKEEATRAQRWSEHNPGRVYCRCMSASGHIWRASLSLFPGKILWETLQLCGKLCMYSVAHAKTCNWYSKPKPFAKASEIHILHILQQPLYVYIIVFHFSDQQKL